MAQLINDNDKSARQAVIEVLSGLHDKSLNLFITGRTFDGEAS